MAASTLDSRVSYDLYHKCELCGYTAYEESCLGGHFLCIRCHNASWVSQSAGSKSVCPIAECSESLRDPPDAVNLGRPRLAEIPKGSDIFERVTKRFLKSSPKLVIERIFRVINPILADSFEMCRSRMLQEQKDPDERLMFHGTSRQASGSIAKSGFDIRYSGTHAQMLGTGIYFAENSGYSRVFSVEDGGGKLCMILTRILVGETSKKENLDTFTGNDIVAIRREQQADPLYVIYYKNQI